MTALSIVDSLDSEALFKPWFAGQSWSTWRAVLRAVEGAPLSKGERALFHAVADRAPPKSRVREFWAVCGRRAGKGSVASVIAAHSAAFFQDGDKLRRGERALVLAVACDRDQARIVLNYIKGFFELPLLKPMVTRETRDGLELSNSVDIAVVTNDFRAVRGRPILCAILDEVAFYRDENSATPDVELLRAIEPGLLTLPSAMLIGISSPYRHSGILHEKWKRHYGQAGDDVLVIRAPSRTMNPTLSQAAIDRALAEDRAAASAEYLAEWRSDIEGVFTQEALDAAVMPGRLELPAREGVQYVAFCDPSGGASDAMTLGIAFNDNGIATLACLREVRPPFSPDEVCDQFVADLRRYGVTVVHGDKYGAHWVVEAFAKKNMVYRHAEKSKSDLYNELIPLINSGGARLLDNEKLLVQLANLERKTMRGGKSSIYHPRGLHDDLGNAAAGALFYASSASNIAPEFVWCGVPLSGGKAAKREREEAARLEGQNWHTGLPTSFNGRIDMRPDRITVDNYLPQWRKENA